MRVRVFAWTLWAATVLLVAGALVLGLTNMPEIPLSDAQLMIIPPAFATLGALISSRRPGNVMGWIFLATGIIGGVQMFFGQYANVALAPDGMVLPAGAYAAWLAMLAQNSFPVSIVFLVLLFPDGMLPSRRWRPVAWAMGVFLAGTLILGALRPGPFLEFPSASNPFGIEGAKPSGMILAAGGLAGLACFLATMLSLIVRFYFSRGEQRLQLKWFTYAVTVGISTPLLLTTLAPEVFRVVGPFVWMIGFLSIPVSAAVAILKYRLYDIDRIINRTLVYGVLTVMLVGIYVGGVVALQYAFRAVTGQTSQLVVVLSTLAIAALFSPLRQRIQDAVDRRFYRRKYDAARTLEEFGVRLRDEVDLDELNGDLVSVVRGTMQPAHVSFWLRPPGRRSGEAVE